MTARDTREPWWSFGSPVPQPGASSLHASSLDALHAEFGDANYVAAPTLRRMVSASRLGRKTGSGFYQY